MASLVLLLSELVRHHNTNPDYWLTLPLPSPTPPPPSSDSAVAKSLSSKCQNNMSRSASMKRYYSLIPFFFLISEFLDHSVSVMTMGKVSSIC
ncbi:hypothetical protein SDJN03_20908, partial [Cucurbita argyrosperma subsp. sororia]